MADIEGTTVQKLQKSFMQFKKTGWHEKKINRFNPSDYKVLATIQQGANEKNTEMKISEISQVLQVTPPTVTQIINNLERDGLVERTVDQEDRRAVKIKLTLAGLEATMQARQKFTETFTGLIDFLGEKESEQLADLLTKVHQYFIELESLNK
ncbi:MAG: MarR family transcriptional regulator [Bacillus sp. (in: Bacteria)]|nr:MarR family transcriptional regulator [Bacillus sp. (in: firmicutes)]